MLTSGQVADCTAGATLLEQLPVCDVNKGYERHPSSGWGAGGYAEHTAQGEPKMEKLLFAIDSTEAETPLSAWFSG